jgi:MarR family transcriptional regulator, transcriptional regulator for hemolysin
MTRTRKKIPRLELTFGPLLVDVVRMLRRDFYARATDVGLTPALTRLLIYVHRLPGSRQTELASQLDVTPVTLGRMVDRLVAKGYVRRRRDALDRRASRLHLTPRAVPLVARMTALARLTTDRALNGIPARERAALDDLLRRVLLNLEGSP